jgi:ergothioneine biosynthesis protein EgtB
MSARIERAQARGKTAYSPTREEYAARYARVRARSLELAAPLSAEDQTIQSMPDASPTKWHLAHVSWFFETFILSQHSTHYAKFDAAFAYLFNSYYEAVGARHPRPQRGLITRPNLQEVHAYRRHIDAAMQHIIESATPAAWATIAALIELGLQHEQQHQELILMDIKHALAQNPTSPAYGAPAPPPAPRAQELHWLAFPGGLHEIGHRGEDFAFDNEGPRHKIWLEPFKLASRLATNSEYCDFIKDGGYQRPEFWLSDGWATVREQQWHAPLYWRGEPGASELFTLAGQRALEPNEPVAHISYYEADAFARWAGKRLATEAEWEVAAAANAHANQNFADLGLFHPQPAQESGLTQMLGDLWEWTASPYAPYPRFRPAPGAIGEYNGKFMCNQMVLRGGAAITPDDHIRITYRNFFPPAARWAFSGIRLADDDE